MWFFIAANFFCKYKILYISISTNSLYTQNIKLCFFQHLNFYNSFGAQLFIFPFNMYISAYIKIRTPILQCFPVPRTAHSDSASLHPHDGWRRIVSPEKSSLRMQAFDIWFSGCDCTAYSLLKLYVGDYILGLVSFLRCIFGMEITVIIACLREFGEGCRQRVDNPNYFLPVIVPALRHLRSESFVSSNIRCFFHIYSNQLLDSQSNK